MHLYFVAISIPEPISSEIRIFQQEMAEQFESSRQLKIPVHITLIPPFRFISDDDVIKGFEKATSKLIFRSDIELNGFNQFREKVLFVSIEQNEELDETRSKIFERITDELSLQWPDYTSNFHPHITIANRDLSYKAFQKAWPIFRERTFSRRFNNIEIVLYKHVKGKWHQLSNIVLC